MTKKEPSVKILVGYHKPAYLLKSDILVPIHLGRALATEASKDGVMSQEDYQWMLDNMIGDDTGDNISKENRKFCELTALYWAWKNYDQLSNPDYIGFMHYRRHFILNPDLKFFSNKLMNQIPIFSFISKSYIKKIKLNDITSLLQEDVILPDFVDVSKIGMKNNLSSFLNYAKIPDFFEKMIEIVSSDYPEYKKQALAVKDDVLMLPGNMFICRKDTFFEYCEFLFDVCFKLDEFFKDFSTKSPEHLRQIAWTSEFITTIFFNKKKGNGNVKQYPISFVENTEKNAAIYFWLKLIKCRFLSKILFGNKKKKYKTKYKRMKGLLKYE